MQTISIAEDGSITMPVHTTLASGRVFSTQATTRMDMTGNGLTMNMQMPGIIFKNRVMKSQSHLTPEDLAAIIRWQLDHPDPDLAKRVRQAFLDIPKKSGLDWVRYFITKIFGTGYMAW